MSFSRDLQPRLQSLGCLQPSHQFTVDESVSDSTQITNYQISATVQDAGVHTQCSQSTDFLFGVMETNWLCCRPWSLTTDRSLSDCQRLVSGPNNPKLRPNLGTTRLQGGNQADQGPRGRTAEGWEKSAIHECLHDDTKTWWWSRGGGGGGPWTVVASQGEGE